ncbi:nuclear transport factor 2 family protein [Ktedonosporobacter rubrisoli]|uniref:Nuclear transport factor 2 family protein n=1 Tax=Ktedonosporobacter rubrisoli TaxID=2509675 RepID=A0A4V0YZT2_KTERU|nr:nuclear transport factor 2 family protein [Ktedonosporobacter rubrisoli]QBD80811.1 nuclear transport factor 2 family protein [Ktedonosporobacter rubrisoli]
MNHSLEEIVHAEKQLQQAMVNNDVQALERLLHDDLVFIDAEGNVQGKREDIESHASGAMVQTAMEFVEEPIMQFYGESAVVAVKAHVKVQLQGKPLEAFCRYLRIWQFQDERWQIIAGTVRIIS